jgi:hypothetical protein
MKMTHPDNADEVMATVHADLKLLSMKGNGKTGLRL